MLWYGDSEALCRVSRGRVCQGRTIQVLHNPHLFKHRHIAIATSFGFHFDVWLPVAWTLQRLLRGVEGTLVQVYAETPFAHGFGEISDQLGLYHGTVKDYETIIADLRANEGDGEIDMVILPTAIADLGHYGKDLVEAWDARDDAHKFMVVGIAHHAQNPTYEEGFAPLARRGALRLLPISDHVSRAFENLVQEFAASPDPVIRSAGFEYVTSDVHVPILNLSIPDRYYPGKLSNVVIQGTFATNMRDFNRIFQDLTQELRDDPRTWGYRPAHDGSPSLVEDTSLSNPFKLHLVGHGWLDIPEELRNVVVFHNDLGYREFYDVMASMDLCLPALKSSYGYYWATASSTVVMCSQVNTPMLVTQRFRKAYSYLDDDRVLVTHPAAMSEVAAIKALRTQDASDFLSSDPSGLGLAMGSHAGVRKAVESMLRHGWVRPKSGFEAWKAGVWARNDGVMARILSDL
ncbi:hypothetical protein HWV62_11526 [Athelia sp. TMB]|nr:hypothetical protein HWV62_11526 [Athelia sp. TMB]